MMTITKTMALTAAFIVPFFAAVSVQANNVSDYNNGADTFVDSGANPTTRVYSSADDWCTAVDTDGPGNNPPPVPPSDDISCDNNSTNTVSTINGPGDPTGLVGLFFPNCVDTPDNPTTMAQDARTDCDDGTFGIADDNGGDGSDGRFGGDYPNATEVWIISEGGQVAIVVQVGYRDPWATTGGTSNPTAFTGISTPVCIGAGVTYTVAVGGGGTQIATDPPAGQTIVSVFVGRVSTVGACGGTPGGNTPRTITMTWTYATQVNDSTVAAAVTVTPDAGGLTCTITFANSASVYTAGGEGRWGAVGSSIMIGPSNQYGNFQSVGPQYGAAGVWAGTVLVPAVHAQVVSWAVWAWSIEGNYTVAFGNTPCISPPTVEWPYCFATATWNGADWAQGPSGMCVGTGSTILDVCATSANNVTCDLPGGCLAGEAGASAHAEGDLGTAEAFLECGGEPVAYAAAGPGILDVDVGTAGAGDLQCAMVFEVSAGSLPYKGAAACGYDLVARSPSPAITYPAPGAVTSGNVFITAEQVDPTYNSYRVDRTLFQVSPDGTSWTTIAEETDLFHDVQAVTADSWEAIWETDAFPPGPYLLRTEMQVDSSSVASDPVPITVTRAPHAVASAAPSAVPGFVEFDGSSSYDPDGSIVAWAWDFGDGNVSAGPVAVHSYADPSAPHQVILTVTDNLLEQSSSYYEVTGSPFLWQAKNAVCTCESIEVRKTGDALGPSADGKSVWHAKPGIHDGKTLGTLKKSLRHTGFAFEVVCKVKGNPDACREVQILKRTTLRKGGITKTVCEEKGWIWVAADKECLEHKTWTGNAGPDLDLDTNPDFTIANEGQCTTAGGTWKDGKCAIKYPKSGGSYTEDDYTKPQNPGYKRHTGNTIIWWDAPRFSGGGAGSKYEGDFRAIIRGSDGKYCYIGYTLSVERKAPMPDEGTMTVGAAVIGANTLP